MISLLHRIKKLHIAAFIVLSVFLSELSTSLMSILLQGRVTIDYLITGGFVSLIISGIVVYFIGQLSRLSEDNENFQREILSPKQAEEALQLTRFTVDKAGDAVYWMDSRARIVDVNETACSMLGYSREELLNLTVLDIDPDFTAKQWVKAWEAVKGKGKLTIETRHLTKGGRIIPVEIMANYLNFGGRELDCAFARDISQRKQTEEALQASEERFRSLVESTSDWIWEVDQKGVYTYVSPQIRNLLGYSPEEVIGKTPFDLMPTDEAQRISEIFKSIATDKESIKNIENINRHKDGGLVVLETSGAPFYDSNGDLRGYRGIDRDITERKKTEEKIEKLNDALRARNEKLEFANKELESFIYSVSHDLRVPLRHISGFADLLMKNIADKLDEKGKRYFSIIRDGTEKMSRLIDDLLNLSRISRHEIQRREVDVSTIAASIVAELREAHPGRNVEVDIKGDLTAVADPGLIEVVFSNLIGNAWKFTAKTEQARIEFGTVEQDGKITYYVRDNGVGFDQKYAGKMFWPFHRLHSEGAFEGTGIGLAIVDRIISLHEGKVWAEGIEGKGATIYFTLT